jgi:RNA polymerase sigma factor (sigma-70 family)
MEPYVSDVALLERWRNQRDAAAAGELIRRHAGMVFGACNRVLRNATDAEDVAQECFIRLFGEEADAGVKVESMAGWLYVLATRRALNLKRGEKRRAVREERYAGEGPPSIEPGDVDDVVEHVDAAIAALPEKLREPIVLHFLEGQSHHKVAETLDIPRSTASNRIARGIEAVREELSKRGVTIAVTALASLLTTEAAVAAPAALTATLGKIALSGGSSAATTTVTGSGISGGMVAAICVGVVVLLGGGATILRGLAPAESAPPESMMTLNSVAEEHDVPASATVDEKVFPGANGEPGPVDTGITVSGRVVDSQGGPIAEAALTLRGTGRGGPLAESTSGSDGSFALAGLEPADLVFLNVKKPPLLRKPSEGFKLTDHGVSGLEVVLYQPASIEGVVVDARNRTMRQHPVTDWWIPGRSSSTIHGTISDDQGRFRIAGLLPGEHKLITISEENMRSDLEDLRLELAEGETRTGVRVVYPGDEPFIAGTVTNEDGEPIRGVLVQCLHKNNSPSVETGEDGSYRLARLPEDAMNFHVNARGYQMLWLNDLIMNQEGLDFVLKRLPSGGVTGRVTDANTGEPVTAFGVKSLRERRTYLTWGDSAFMEEVHDPDGRFTLDKVEGQAPTIIVRAAGFATAFVPVTVDSELGTEISVALEPSRVVEGTVVTENGAPVAEAYIFVGAPPYVNHWRDTYGPAALRSELAKVAAAESATGGVFRLDSISATTHTVTAFHPEYGWGRLPVAMDAPVVTDARIVMEATGTIAGRVTRDGEPAEEVRVNVRHNEMQHSMSGAENETDANGEYRLPGIAAGPVQVSFQFDWGGGMRPGSTVYREFVVEEGSELRVDVDHTTTGSVLRGHVSLAGVPAEEGNVSLDIPGESGRFTSGAQIQDGKYLIKSVPLGEGTLRVGVRPPEGDWIHRQVPVSILDVEEIVVDVDISGSSSVSGVVEGVRDLERARVVVLYGAVDVLGFQPEDFWELQEQTAGADHQTTDGTYTVPMLKPGDYTVVGISEIYANRGTDVGQVRAVSAEITLGDGEEAVVDVEFR